MSVSALQACLEKEIQLMGEFLDALRAEATALEDGATESALAETTTRKTEKADALTDIARQRNDLLKNLGCAENGAGLAAAAQAHPALASLREQLIDVTEQARELNEANGRIIEVYLDHNQRTLDVLRQLAGVGDMYDASGRKRSSGKGSSRNIKA